MNTNQARETARQSDGRFGAQLHAESQGLSLAAPVQRQSISVSTSAEGLDRMQDLDQPFGVRLAAANTGYAGTAMRAAADPNPIVRAAAVNGWDLPAFRRRVLARDPAVQRVMAVLSA